MDCRVRLSHGCYYQEKADYLRFLKIAFGSLRELHYQLSLAKRLGFMEKQDYSGIEVKVIEAEKTISGLIRALKQN